MIAILSGAALFFQLATSPAPRDSRSVVEQSTTSLCSALGQLRDDDHLEVVLSGIYQVGYETSVFFQREHPQCVLDVEPSTWVEFLPNVVDSVPGFERLIEREGWAQVTFAGTLEGPRKVGPDDPSLPVMGSYANRIAHRRYGHMNAFRTQFVITQILRFSSVAPGTPRYGEWAQPRKSWPLLIAAELPKYPAAAQKAGIEGTVTVDVRVENGMVVATEPIAGDRVLAAEVVANLHTWRFESGVATRFTTTFDFELERRPSGVDTNTRLELHLPEYARIVGAENGW
jgi:hypothetical protein